MKITKWKDAKENLKNTKISYLWFGAEWCGDCLMMEPVLEELINHFKDDKDILFQKVDAEESNLFRDSESPYQVLKIPTHVFLKNGEIQNIKYEYLPLEIMIEEINKLK